MSKFKTTIFLVLLLVNMIMFHKIEDFVKARNFRTASEINTGEAQYGFLNDPEACFDWRAGKLSMPMDGEIDRDVQHPRTLGVIHSEEKYVAPSTMGKIHANGRAFTENRIDPGGRVTLGQLWPNAKRLIRWVSHAKHPLVTSHGAH
jgi:hypothetical protein